MPVAGDNFLSRKLEVNTLTNLLKQKQNVLIYDAPKTGKKSLVSQSLLNLQKSSYNYTVCNVSLLNIRSNDALFREMALKMASSFSDLSLTLSAFINKYLPYIDIDSDAPLSHKDIAEILSLPEKLSSDFSTNLIVYFEDFQNLLLFDDPDETFKLLEKGWADQANATYLITGSRINAMKYIFEEQKYFYHFAEYVNLSPLEEKAVIDRIIKVFLKVGRVIDQDLAAKIYNISCGNPFYVWQLSSFCFDLTKGYMNDSILNEAIDSVLSLHDTYYRTITDNLSNYQVRFLRAIFDGITRFSSVEIINKYSLNSSGNVHRLKEAVKKKEIVAFDDDDVPYIIDPIFKLWLSRYYFID